MYSSVRWLTLPLLFLLSHIANAGCQHCVLPSEEVVITRTENFILQSEKLQIPSDLFGPGENYVCALLSFDIGDDGYAKNIEVVRSYPRHRLDRSGIWTLRNFRFTPSQNIADRKGMFLFEAELPIK